MKLLQVYSSYLTALRYKGRFPKYPKAFYGIFKNDGMNVIKGETLVRQRQLNIHPGLFVSVHQDKRLVASVDGKVMFSTERVNLNFDDPVIEEQDSFRKSISIVDKLHINVVPHQQPNTFRLVETI